MTKIVINSDVGGFGISRAAYRKLRKLHDKHLPVMKSKYSFTDCPRDCPNLILVVEELGEKANGEPAKLKVIEVPDGVEWQIERDDTGVEWVAEKHRTWS